MRASKLAFMAAILCAVATLVFPILFGSPPDLGAAPMADGFVTPILALEFARSADDLAFLQGEGGAALRAFLVETQSLDRFFPLAYAGMAALFFLARALRGQRLAWLGVILGLATVVADWNENAGIEPFLENGGYAQCQSGGYYYSLGNEPVWAECRETGHSIQDGAGEVVAVFHASIELRELQAATWIKWGLIALYAALFSAVLWQDKRRLLAMPGLVAAASIAATWLSGSSGQIAEIMGALLIPFMLTFPLAAVMYLRVKSAPHEAGAPPQNELEEMS